MKIALKIISAIVLLTWLVGFIATQLEHRLAFLLPFGWLLFALIWMPFFLFYAYDRKQRRKEGANESNDLEV